MKHKTTMEIEKELALLQRKYNFSIKNKIQNINKDGILISIECVLILSNTEVNFKYINNGKETIEERFDNHIKKGIGLNLNYFLENIDFNNI